MKLLLNQKSVCNKAAEIAGFLLLLKGEHKAG